MLLRSVWVTLVLAISADIASAAPPPGCKTDDPLANWSGAWENKIAGLVLDIQPQRKVVVLVAGGNVLDMPYEIERCIGSAIAVKGTPAAGQPKRFVLHTAGKSLQFAPEGDAWPVELDRSQ